MTSQVDPAIAVNGSLAENYRLEPITFDLVCRRMAMGREALEKQVVPAYLKSTPADPHVTPTDRFASNGSRIASTAPAAAEGRDIGSKAPQTRELQIAELERIRDRLLDSVEGLGLVDPVRVERELAASVVHHRVFDLLTGGRGIDRRSDVELAWERRWRETPYTEDRALIYDRRGAGAERRWYRLGLLNIPDDAWREIY